MLSTRDSHQNEIFPQAENKGMDENTPCKWKRKKIGVAICISDKIDFETKSIKRDKEGHYIILKGPINKRI